MPDEMSRTRLRTGAAALVIFALFAVAVVAFHAVARPDSPTVGISAWTDPDVTSARLERVLSTLLQRAPLANALAHDEAIVGAMAPAEGATAAKRWAVLDSVAEALTSDEARRRLAERWTADPWLTASAAAGLTARSTQRGGRGTPPEPDLRQLVRATVRRSGSDRAVTVKAIADTYRDALEHAVRLWARSEIGLRRVEFMLGEQSLTVADGDTAAFLESLHDRLVAVVAVEHVDDTLQAVIANDLTPQVAPERLATAVHGDFAARWTWIITASLLLTLAVSAIIGSLLRFAPLVVDANRRRLAVALLAAATLIVGLASAVGLPTVIPPFLSDAVAQLDVIPALAVAILVLNGVAGGAVAALFTTAWTSFLVSTTDNGHLRRQLAAVRWVFHMATIVMVAGVFEMYAVTSWPSATLPAAAAHMVASGAQTAAVAVGIAVSTLLLLIYLPAAQALTGVARARHAAGDDRQKAEIDAILAETGFNESPTQQVLTFAQLLSPLLVAPLASLVGLIAA